MNAPTQPAAPSLGRIMLLNVRLSFAQGLFEAGVIPGSDASAKPKYNCGLLLPPDHPQMAEIGQKMRAVAKAQWKDKADAIYAALKAANKLAIHDGATKPKYEGYPGMYFLSPSSPENKPPTLIATVAGVNRTLDVAAARKKFYSGCYVNASLEFWAQDNNWGQRINAQLRGVQFFKDGDAFAGGGTTADAGEFGLAPEEGAEAADFGDAAGGDAGNPFDAI